MLALGSSLVALVCKSGVGSEEVDAVLFVGHSKGGVTKMLVDGENRSVPIVNFRLSPRSAIRNHLMWILFMAILYRLLPLRRVRKFIASRTPWIEALEECDIVGDIRGGDSFSDIYGIKRFLIGFLPAWSVLLVKGRNNLIQFPQTYGPYRSALARTLAGWLLKRSQTILARDRESQKIAEDIMRGNETVILCPDVAFSLESSMPAKIPLVPASKEPAKCEVIGINVNGLLYNGGYDRDNMFGLKIEYPLFLLNLLKRLCVENVEIWLVPHTFAPAGDVESDNEACEILRGLLPENLKGRVRLVAGDCDQHEIKGVIGACDFFVGSRMHSCIAALSQGIPCVGVAYSRKFRGVFETVGVEDWIVDGREVDTDRAVQGVLDLYHRRKSIATTLTEAVEGARTDLDQVFKDIVSPQPRDLA